MERVGLVFAGGGGKGAYHIGVWKALREYGIDNNITSISGTSIGALNSVLFIQGNIELAEEAWLSISPDKILSLDLRKLSPIISTFGITDRIRTSFLKWSNRISKFGVFSRSGFLELLEEYVQLDQVSNSNISCYVTCCEIPLLKTHYFKLNSCSKEKMKSLLLATTALPVIFDPVELDGKNYIDGGVRDNIPIQPLFDEGCRNFIVVHLGRDETINYNQFPGANIIEIVPQEDQGGLIDGTLDFTPEGARRRIEQGYQDTVRILKPIYEMGIVQKKIEIRLNELHTKEQEFKTKRAEILAERDNYKDELATILNERISSKCN